MQNGIIKSQYSPHEYKWDSIQTILDFCCYYERNMPSFWTARQTPIAELFKYVKDLDVLTQWLQLSTRGEKWSVTEFAASTNITIGLLEVVKSIEDSKKGTSITPYSIFQQQFKDEYNGGSSYFLRFAEVVTDTKYRGIIYELLNGGHSARFLWTPKKHDIGIEYSWKILKKGDENFNWAFLEAIQHIEDYEMVTSWWFVSSFEETFKRTGK